MVYSEKWGVDVEEAVRLALEDMKLSEEEVTVTVLEEPTNGFFGIGRKLAKVRVEKKKKDDQPPSDWEDNDALTQKSKNKKAEKKTRRKVLQSEESGEEEKADKDFQDLKLVKDHAALTFLTEVTEKMGLSLDMKCLAGEDTIYVIIEGKDSGTVIGKRGQTLDAIQYLTSLVVNKDREKYVKVVIDAENYREKRQKTLEQLAKRLAGKVQKTKKHVKLEPMNPYERKVIHATLQGYPNIATRSEGEDPYRKVVIQYKK